MLSFQTNIPFLGPKMPDYIIEAFKYWTVQIKFYRVVLDVPNSAERAHTFGSICLLETLTTPVGTSSSQLAID